jgi:hypothetical protein
MQESDEMTKLNKPFGLGEVYLYKKSFIWIIFDNLGHLQLKIVSI